MLIFCLSYNEIIRTIEYPALPTTSSADESSASITFNYDERPSLLPTITLHDTPCAPQLAPEFMYRNDEQLDDDEEIESFLKAM